jgi:choline dehydrogenase-like flavoprotein
MTQHYDVIIIGTGAGGGTLASRLAPSGKRILLLERGDHVPREKDNWSPRAVNVEATYHTDRAATSPSGTPRRPRRSTPIAEPRRRQSVRRRRQLLSVERRGQSGVDDHGQCLARWRPPTGTARISTPTLFVHLFRRAGV